MINRCPVVPPIPSEPPCFQHVLYFVWERECIRIAKENNYDGELTKDPILKQYRFCNVRRRDDRVSKWIIENMLVHADPEEDDIWFITAIARYVNWPPMLQKLLSEGLVPCVVEEFDYAAFGECIDAVTRAGGKGWGGAYMTYPPRVEKGQAKGIGTAKHTLAPLAGRAESIRAAVRENRVESVVTSMLGVHGWQMFMCGQVAADLTYTPQLEHAEDLYTWAPIGPGSLRGLNRLNGRKLDAVWGQEDFNRHLRDLKNVLEVELELEGPLSLHDVQNVMCEMDKMWRVLYGEGAPRNLYKPETAY